MDDEYPFGQSFGRASKRTEAIDCSHSLYYKLLKSSPKSDDLPFEVLSWIAIDENDEQDVAKLQALRRVFRPDAHENLPLLAFVHVSQKKDDRHMHNVSALTDYLPFILFSEL